MPLILLQAAETARNAGFDMNTGVSVALLIVVLGAVWRGSAILQEMKSDLKALSKVPIRLRHIEDHLVSSEEDHNNMWAVLRAGPEAAKVLELTRRARFQPLREDD